MHAGKIHRPVAELGRHHELRGDGRRGLVFGSDIVAPCWRGVGSYRVESSWFKVLLAVVIETVIAVTAVVSQPVAGVTVCRTVAGVTVSIVAVALTVLHFEGML